MCDSQNLFSRKKRRLKVEVFNAAGGLGALWAPQQIHKNLVAPFYRWGSTDSRLQNHYKEVVYVLHVPRNSWYSFDQPQGRALVGDRRVKPPPQKKKMFLALTEHLKHLVSIYFNCNHVSVITVTLLLIFWEHFSVPIDVQC